MKETKEIKMGEDRRDIVQDLIRIEAKGREKTTRLALAHYLNEDGCARASIRQLAWDSGHSERTVQRHLRTLENRKEIVVAVGGREKGDTNAYYLPYYWSWIEQELKIG